MCSGLDREDHGHGDDAVRDPSIEAVPRRRNLAGHRSRYEVTCLGRTVVDLQSETERAVVSKGVQSRRYEGCDGDISALVLGVEEVEIILATSIGERKEGFDKTGLYEHARAIACGEVEVIAASWPGCNRG